MPYPSNLSISDTVKEVRRLKRWFQAGVFSFVYALIPLYAFVFNMEKLHILLINAIGLSMAIVVIEVAFAEMLKLRLRSEQGLRDADEQVIVALAVAVEGKDATTHGHLQRLARYALRLGEALGLDDRQLLFLRYGAILHDIGKIAIPESIVSKPGPLSTDEWYEMRKHPVVGQQICAPLRFSDEVGPLIRHHHERWDGTGYVDSLAGDQIPYLSRVISVVDAFDAMTSDRPYRPALSVDEAMKRLAEGSGTQWDPVITDVFLGLIRTERLDPVEVQSDARQEAA